MAPIERFMPLTGLALCVMNGAVRDGDRFVFNTCGCTIRSASRDKLGGFFFVLIISISFHLRLLTADVVTEGWATAAAHRLSVLWKAEKWDTMLMTDVFRCFICPCCFQSH